MTPSRALCVRGELVLTTMPGWTGQAHDATGFGAFSTSTKHIRQFPAIMSFLLFHLSAHHHHFELVIDRKNRRTHDSSIYDKSLVDFQSSFFPRLSVRDRIVDGKPGNCDASLLAGLDERRAGYSSLADLALSRPLHTYSISPSIETFLPSIVQASQHMKQLPSIEWFAFIIVPIVSSTSAFR